MSEIDVYKLSESEIVQLEHKECFTKIHYFTVKGKTDQIRKFVILLFIVMET